MSFTIQCVHDSDISIVRIRHWIVTVALFAASWPVPVTAQVNSVSVDDRSLMPLSTVRKLLVSGDAHQRWCTPPPDQMLDGPTKWTISVRHSGITDWMRLHLVLEKSDSQSGWWVDIVDPTNATSQPERVDESLLLPGGGRWSSRVYGNSVAVKLHTRNKLTNYSLCVDAYSFSTQDAQIEPKLLIDGHTDHREDLLRTSPFYKLGHSIALVYFQKVGAAEDFSCSGFAISPSLFITNNHCISSEEQLSTAGVWYNYETDNDEPPLEIKFAGLVTTNAYFDYTLLRLDKVVEAQYIAHLLLSKLPDTSPDIIQIQHPAGGKKKIAAPCKVESINASDVADGVADFYHLCDASPGSSGSPIMIASSGLVIGLHNGGNFNADTFNNHNSALKVDQMLSHMLVDVQASRDPRLRAAYAELESLH